MATNAKFIQLTLTYNDDLDKWNVRFLDSIEVPSKDKYIEIKLDDLLFANPKQLSNDYFKLTKEQVVKVIKDDLEVRMYEKPTEIKGALIDPPEGHKYGFPKFLQDYGEKDIDVIKWLLKEGYPQQVIDLYGDAFKYRVIHIK